ncbi:bifunctional DedA family/phosphatase PAP2 family protein [Alkalimarinus sediminis]|uniref:Bifunctional DedA family/phosphatase PAP2 family protein n=1 Tax=Alkalimarinus sediminis TaxID=1632866 RepID=A0A9E8HJH3_9ALTE|nr:bifunctional DedA family/phosphatase PAP2 family protein [Alkalimarinus sediminis]UZW73818.1 bifunctional DedA family/phosphatase PAP2 family protein [Alkalimarinus sediminis]
MNASDIQPLIEGLQAHQGWVAFAIFIVSFVESLAIAGVIVPGVMLLFMVAAVAGGGALSLEAALICAFAGAVLGDGISFFIGRYFKASIAQVWPVSRYPKLLHNGQTFFEKHGGKSVLIGRFVGPVRPILPLIAGMLDMSPKRFLLFNVVSAIGWAPVYILPGYLVGASVSLDIELPPHFYPVLLTALGILSVTYLLFVRLQWGLHPQSDSYNYIKQVLMRYDVSQKLWTGLSNRRVAGGEFPLPSLILALATLTLFILLAQAVSYTQWFESFNQQASDFFVLLRNPFYDPAVVIITMIGDPKLLYISVPIFVSLLFFRGYYAAAIHIAVAGIATSLVTHGLKDYFAIARPDLVVSAPLSAAFPSGHTSGAVFFFGLLAAFIAQEMEQKKRWVIYSLFSVPMLLIGLSRLYLGVHWASDVLGGMLLGLCICAITRVSYSRYDRQAISVDIFTLLAVALWLVAVTVYVWTGLPEAIARYQMIPAP